MSKKLTIKQETFCQEYVKTGNASEAYRIAYNSSNMKPETINRKAVEVLENGKVTARLKELQAQQEEKHSITKDKILNRLKQVIFDQESMGIEKTDLSALNKAVDTINKMQGYYEAEKHDAKLEIIIKTKF